MQKAISIFINSAGAMLLALASALFLINWASPPDYVPPHDPILVMPVSELFRIVAGTVAIIALVCFFSERRTFPACLVLWLAFEYLVCRIGLIFEGCHTLTGYLGGFSYTFGIPANVANATGDVFFAYLLIGSCIVLWLASRLPSPMEFQRMFCPACGGHVKFSVDRLGQKTDCPHCKVLVALRKPEELLKMDCFFCKEHIEFPAHALGRKIRCPHCKMEIGLRETA